MTTPRPRYGAPVRTVVEFACRGGDLTTAAGAASRAAEGSRVHRSMQRGRPPGWRFEAPVSLLVPGEGFDLEVGGRVDALFQGEGPVVVEEFKSTTRDPALLAADPPLVHLAQLQVYGAIIAEREDLAGLELVLTYVSVDDGRTASARRTVDRVELLRRRDELLAPYLAWLAVQARWEGLRNESLASCPFPFPSPRPGQDELMAAVALALEDRSRLFVRAPTGIGKTMACLLPALRALPLGHAGRVFYLTARTTGRTAAAAALAELRRTGLRLRSVELTARDKICPMPCEGCEPEGCPRAAGHFDRVGGAIAELLEQEDGNGDVVSEVAAHHAVCPFELSLDAAEWSDLVVCDYNYVFDPRVRLKRFFAGGPCDCALLVDEAHNLGDRAREMFSAALDKGGALDARKAAPTPALKKAAGAVNSWFLARGRALRDEGLVSSVERELPEGLLPLLRTYTGLAEERLAGGDLLPEPLVDLFFASLTMLRTADEWGPDFATVVDGSGRDLRLRLSCLDPARLLGERLRRVRSTVMFSATLSPMPYFRRLLGGSDDDACLELPSPFPPENLQTLVVDTVATTYKRRHLSLDGAARALACVVAARRGNYLAFFPSYAYLDAVAGRLTGLLPPDTELLIQRPGLDERARADFLAAFAPDRERTLLGLAVMGGIFGEGVDLRGERLVGVAVVGVGLPAVCLDREVLRDHYEETLGEGFAHAYLYPGMNRVLQAAGRLIRGETDRGVLLLVGERYGRDEIRDLLPREWAEPATVRTPGALTRRLRTFWGEEEPKA